MKTYIITFTESKYIENYPEQNKVYAYLEAFKHWARLSESTYILQSDLKSSEIKNKILEITNNRGEVYIIDCTDCKYSVFGPSFIVDFFEKYC